MMRTALTGLLLAGLSTVFFADTSYAQNRCGSRGTFNNLETVGLTADNRLVCFREVGGGGVRDIGTITGLVPGDTLVGIDFRPADGLLYGVGVPSSTVYQFAAGQSGTIVATPMPALTDALNPTVPVLLSGTQFGVDFNPVPDRLRITSDTGQNLRINVVTGVTNIDGGINNGMMAPQLGVAAAAYTNNDTSAQTVTVLHTLDTDAVVDPANPTSPVDQLFIQVPPNAGTQNAVGTFSLGGTPVDSGNGSSFDIFSLTQPVTVNGVAQTATVATRGLVVFTPAGSTNSVLYNIALNSGALTVRRNFGPNNQIVGIAIPLLQGN